MLKRIVDVLLQNADMTIKSSIGFWILWNKDFIYYTLSYLVSELTADKFKETNCSLLCASSRDIP
jgi:hypothetical protein